MDTLVCRISDSTIVNSLFPINLITSVTTGRRPLSASPCPRVVPASAASGLMVSQAATAPASAESADLVTQAAPLTTQASASDSGSGSGSGSLSQISHPPTPSPGSSSDSGSGTDTVKCGVPPHRPTFNIMAAPNGGNTNHTSAGNATTATVVSAPVTITRDDTEPGYRVSYSSTNPFLPSYEPPGD